MSLKLPKAFKESRGKAFAQSPGKTRMPDTRRPTPAPPPNPIINASWRTKVTGFQRLTGWAPFVGPFNPPTIYRTYRRRRNYVVDTGVEPFQVGWDEQEVRVHHVMNDFYKCTRKNDLNPDGWYSYEVSDVASSQWSNGIVSEWTHPSPVPYPGYVVPPNGVNSEPFPIEQPTYRKKWNMQPLLPGADSTSTFFYNNSFDEEWLSDPVSVSWCVDQAKLHATSAQIRGAIVCFPNTGGAWWTNPLTYHGELGDPGNGLSHIGGYIRRPARSPSGVGITSFHADVGGMEGGGYTAYAAGGGWPYPEAIPGATTVGMVSGIVAYASRVRFAAVGTRISLTQKQWLKSTDGGWGPVVPHTHVIWGPEMPVDAQGWQTVSCAIVELGSGSGGIGPCDSIPPAYFPPNPIPVEQSCHGVIDLGPDAAENAFGWAQPSIDPCP